MKNKVYTTNENLFISIVYSSSNLADVIIKLGYKTRGVHTVKLVKQRCEDLGIDVDAILYPEKGCGISEKYCTMCKICKPVEVFNFKNSSTGTRQSKCKDCEKKVRACAYRKNPSQAKNRAARIKARNTSWYKAYKLKQKCSSCDESHTACLDFHHKDPNKKDFCVSLMISGGYSIARIKKEMEKCIILCKNCHAKLHYIT